MPSSRIRIPHPFQPTRRAGDRVRTGDSQLGKLVLYQLSYTREGTGSLDRDPAGVKRECVEAAYSMESSAACRSSAHEAFNGL